MMQDDEVEALLEGFTETFAVAMLNVGLTKDKAAEVFVEYARLIEGELFNRLIEENYDNQSD